MTGPATIRTPLGQRLRRARMGALPLVVWAAALAISADLLLGTPRPSTYLALAEAQEMSISSPADGRLGTVLVELYETVGSGQPLATMDPAPLEARMETARAELERLSAEVGAQRATLVTELEAARNASAARHGLSLSAASLEVPAEIRAFHSDEADLEIGILDTRLARTTSELEVDRIEVRLKRAESLVEQRIGPTADAEDLRKRLEQERARVGSLHLIEAEMQSELELARMRRRAVEDSYLGPPQEVFGEATLEARLAGWKEALVVQERRMDELELLRQAFVLRAPASGQVASLVASEGQYLLAGDPVLVLIHPEPGNVTLWVSEATPVFPRIGDRFLVARVAAASPDAAAECVVRGTSPRIEPLPARLWRDPRVPEYGRACTVGPVAALGLVPGERVSVEPLGRPD